MEPGTRRPFLLSYNYVCAATQKDGSEAVLKIGVPNPELTSEINALTLYNGQGACRILEADPENGMLLLERLQPGTMLASLGDDDQATGIAAEVAALHMHGARHFRVGRQPDILAYGAGSGEYPAPRPDLLEKLFSSIRTAAPGLKTLHIDNTNPVTIARHEEESREALRAIIRHHTSGDVAAFGMETADPAVIAANNLKAQPDEVFRAIEIVNEEGGKRREHVPELLPGLNFVCGLAGETEQTYELNEQFLVRVLDAGLSVRRVNIRQVMPFEGTPAYMNNTLGQNEQRFRAFKEFVRNTIDLPMLQRVYPIGTVLRDVRVEVTGDLSFGRQLGSYPIRVGLPLNLPRNTVTDAVVVDWGMRSITALPVPVGINSLPASAIRWLPGVGKKKVAFIIAKRPFKDPEEYRKVAGSSMIDSLMKF